MFSEIPGIAVRSLIRPPMNVKNIPIPAATLKFVILYYGSSIGLA